VSDERNAYLPAMCRKTFGCQWYEGHGGPCPVDERKTCSHCAETLAPDGSCPACMLADCGPCLRAALARALADKDALAVRAAEAGQREFAALRERDAARKERDEARATNRDLNRRCQQAEAAARENVEACRRSGVSLGRGLGHFAAAMFERERDEARAALAERDRQLAEARGLLHEAVEAADLLLAEVEGQGGTYGATRDEVRRVVAAYRASQGSGSGS
jgi:hypothetical protein